MTMIGRKNGDSQRGCLLTAVGLVGGALAAVAGAAWAATEAIRSVV